MPNIFGFLALFHPLFTILFTFDYAHFSISGFIFYSLVFYLFILSVAFFFFNGSDNSLQTKVTQEPIIMLVQSDTVEVSCF